MLYLNTATGENDVRSTKLINIINEYLNFRAHLTNNYNFFIPSFRVYVTNRPDGKAYGGTAVLARNRLNRHALKSHTTDQLHIKKLG